MREQARAQKDWVQSDKLRDELRALGVDIFDKEKIWRSRTGASGVVIGYRGAGGPTDLEISTLVVQRERARQSGDFPTSDMIRDELKAAGVEIRDREKMWQCSDGRSGPIPTWSAILNGGATAAPTSGATPQNVAAAGNLQSQVVQAALAAAQNPSTAVRTLQLLQQASVPGAPVMKMAGRATMPATSSNTECQEAIDFIYKCQASGRPPMDAEIDQLVGLREKFRQGKDFTAADELRNAMRSALGVELYEKEKKWTAAGGRQGVIPMWSSLV
uniref:Cysteinyl-tRNA ligase anticodon binding domain-containing protein n=1 Tax=Alexandrium monilatum TaxID=311494 RepID=A0A7S4RHJ6_9DINO